MEETGVADPRETYNYDDLEDEKPPKRLTPGKLHIPESDARDVDWATFFERADDMVNGGEISPDDYDALQDEAAERWMASRRE